MGRRYAPARTRLTGVLGSACLVKPRRNRGIIQYSKDRLFSAPSDRRPYRRPESRQQLAPVLQRPNPALLATTLMTIYNGLQLGCLIGSWPRRSFIQRPEEPSDVLSPIWLALLRVKDAELLQQHARNEKLSLQTLRSLKEAAAYCMNNVGYFDVSGVAGSSFLALQPWRQGSWEQTLYILPANTDCVFVAWPIVAHADIRGVTAGPVIVWLRVLPSSREVFSIQNEAQYGTVKRPPFKLFEAGTGGPRIVEQERGRHSALQVDCGPRCVFPAVGPRYGCLRLPALHLAFFVPYCDHSAS